MSTFFDDIEDDIQTQYDENFYDKVDEFTSIKNRLHIISKESLVKFGPDTFTVTPNELTHINITNSIKHTDTLSSYFNNNIIDNVNITYVALYGNNKNDIIRLGHLFHKCSALQTVIIQNFDTSNVNNMSFMFYGCETLSSLDIQCFNTANVIYIDHIFFGCKSLKTLDVSNFDTSNVFTMDSMFSGCKSLTSLDLSNFNTSKVTNMFKLFYDCESLESLDLSNFDISNIIYYNDMFTGCHKLKHIKCKQEFKDWCMQHQYTLGMNLHIREGNCNWEIIN